MNDGGIESSTPNRWQAQRGARVSCRSRWQHPRRSRGPGNWWLRCGVDPLPWRVSGYRSQAENADLIPNAFDRHVERKRQRYAHDDRAVGAWELRVKADGNLALRAEARRWTSGLGRTVARTYGDWLAPESLIGLGRNPHLRQPPPASHRDSGHRTRLASSGHGLTP